MNTNCLQGKRCPKCGQTEKLLVAATTFVALTDDGTDPMDSAIKNRDTEYDDISYTECPECHHTGRYGEFGPGTDGMDVYAFICAPSETGLNYWSGTEWVDNGFDRIEFGLHDSEQLIAELAAARSGREEALVGFSAGALECYKLETLVEEMRPHLVVVAQEVYNEWDQDEEGVDDEYGEGGICDAIADAVNGFLTDIGLDAESYGDDHAITRCSYLAREVHIDLPASVYERGSGYKYTKIPGVVFQTSDFHITTFQNEQHS